MRHYAKIRIEEYSSDGGNDIYKKEGEAQRVIMDAMEYLRRKDSEGIFKKVVNWIAKDFKAFDQNMNKVFKLEKKQK